jgi:hypothetical protein
MNGITKTIPKKEGLEALEQLYALEGEYEFHMAGTPSRLNVGDYVYTIFDDQLRGRCKIVRMEGGAVNPKSGRPRTLIYVQTPGEKLNPPVAKKGHRGTRYYDGSEWPA